MITDILDGYHQILGHTVILKPEFVQQIDKSATFIDLLDSMAYFHEINRQGHTLWQVDFIITRAIALFHYATSLAFHRQN